MAELLGLKITDISKDQLMAQIDHYLVDNTKHWLVTANPEILLASQKDYKYQEIINLADMLVPDGIGLIVMSFLLRRRIKYGRFTGVDLVEEIMKKYRNSKETIAMIGESDEILQRATHKLSIKYGDFNNLLYISAPKYNSYSNLIDEELNNGLIKFLQDKKVTILLIGLGAPKQEFWINHFLSKIPSAKFAIGVGGSFDYISGYVSRAPLFIQRFGFEWLWRLVKQPRRWRRIVNAVVIFPLVVCFYEFKRMFHMEHNKH